METFAAIVVAIVIVSLVVGGILFVLTAITLTALKFG